MANNDMDRVVPLGQLDDFKVAEGDPDVRGWEVLASDGRKIGEVDELLVDTSAMKVRYLDVDVDDGVIGDGMDRHVLIPIGYARLEQERDCVMVDGLASADLNALPAYDQGPLTRDFESSVRDSFAGRRADATTGGTVSGGSAMVDTAGLDNTPGTGTALGMTGAGAGTRDETRALNDRVPDGAGMRAAGYDVDGESTRSTGSALGGSPGSLHATDSALRDTGSPRAGLGRDAGTTGGGLSAGSTAGSPGLGGGSGDRLSASTTRGPGVVGGSGNAPVSAGSQGPPSGMGTDRGPQGDVSHRAGMAGSDYLHDADEDFYASDAFDDDRFYGARRGGPGGDVGGGMRAGGLGGPDGGGGATREDVDRLSREASDRLREDHHNRDVGRSGNL
ncbi:MAG TPA: PRC-barrel domain-containing protein [Longimicrobium sp.]